MDDDGLRISEELFPKARKEHKCCECGKTIPIGQKYQLYKGCWDGKWSKYRTCMDCNELRIDVGQRSYYNEWPPFGKLHEWAEEVGLGQEK